MKKISLILCLMLAAASLVSCTDVQYIEIHADWMHYKTAEELVDYAKTIYIGRVTDIYFEVLEWATGEPVKEETEDRNRHMFSLYKIEVLDLYKGNEDKASLIGIGCGIKGYKEKEQLEAVKNGKAYDWETNSVFIHEGYIGLKEGETYLFVLNEREEVPFLIPPNLYQFSYCLSDPELKTSYHDNEITAEDIVKTFGEDKLAEFTAKYR